MDIPSVKTGQQLYTYMHACMHTYINMLNLNLVIIIKGHSLRKHASFLMAYLINVQQFKWEISGCSESTGTERSGQVRTCCSATAPYPSPAKWGGTGTVHLGPAAAQQPRTPHLPQDQTRRITAAYAWVTTSVCVCVCVCVCVWHSHELMYL